MEYYYSVKGWLHFIGGFYRQLCGEISAASFFPTPPVFLITIDEPSLPRFGCGLLGNNSFVSAQSKVLLKALSAVQHGKMSKSDLFFASS